VWLFGSQTKGTVHNGHASGPGRPTADRPRAQKLAASARQTLQSEAKRSAVHPRLSSPAGKNWRFRGLAWEGLSCWAAGDADLCTPTAAS